MTESRPSGEGWVVVVTEETMKTTGYERHRDRERLWRIALLLGGALVLSVACSKEVTPGAEPQSGVGHAPVGTSAAAVAARPEPGPQPQAAPTASETAEALAGSNKLSEPNFDLSIETKGEFKSGQASTVEIVLIAKSPFKVNDKYPYKFKVKETAGLKFSGPVIKDGVKLEKTRAVLPVPFTPESTGKKQIAGRFDFSVCTPERCLIEKRELALAIDVK